eukprot:TRINITY_DN1813_c0_g1_i2.p1 TRINITY_DN1813_c0_g1~~TRINITY_DN1813_c0_g1_i2.p1  ORF type:complete len:573 (-),score=160.49 TRINITY_DN1813_c0_g1_i2:1773-3491(-)
MGAYLGKPNTEKESGDGENSQLKFGVSAMQGWRMGMEDAHSTILDLDGETTGFFAVFDGHGGKEVAQYCSRHLHEELLKCEAYLQKDVPQGLIHSYLRMDELMCEESGRLELRDIVNDKHFKEPSSSGAGGGGSKSKTNKTRASSSDADSAESGPWEDSSAAPLNPVVIEELDDGQPMEASITTAAAVVELEPNGPPYSPLSSSDPASSRKRPEPSDTAAESIRPAQARSKATNQSVPAGSPAPGDGLTAQIAAEPPLGAAAAGKEGTDMQKAGDAQSRGGSGEQMDAQDVDIVFLDSSDDAIADDDDVDDDEEFVLGEETLPEEEEEEEEYDAVFETSEAAEPEEMAPSNYRGPHAGCTAVVAVIRGNDLVVANAGDSRCVMSRRGKVLELSMDHKPDLKEEKARISKAGGFIVDGRINGSLNLSRAIGDIEYKLNSKLDAASQMVTAYPETRSVTLEAGDEFLVLACDGVWDVMTSQQVVDFVRERLVEQESQPEPQPEDQRLSRICEEIFDVCVAPDSKGTGGGGLGMDNMSAIIVRLKHVTPVLSPGPSTAGAGPSSSNPGAGGGKGQ